MMHRSTETEYERVDGKKVKPKIYALEIRHRDHPDGDPIMWFLIERQETIKQDTDGNMFQASISLFWQQITAEHSYQKGAKGDFSGSYSKYSAVLFCF
jgi:hypothetical protein